MRVLVIPEDFRNDQYLLKPLFERLFRAIGKARARVRVCQDPLLGGIDQALNSERVREVVEQHRGMADIFILCVDRDGTRDGARDWTRSRPSLETAAPFSPRMLGRRSKLGRWRAWTFLRLGAGRTFARRSMSRSGISTFWRKSAASPTVSAAVARRWATKPRAISPRSAGNASRTSTPSPGVLEALP